MPKATQSVTRSRRKSPWLWGLLFFLWAGPVLAHDDAAWIMEGQYKDRNGVHCCSPNRDCLPVEAGEIVRINGGWKHVPTGTVLMDGDPGIHENRDPHGKSWRCVRGEFKCFFPGVET